MTGPDRVQRSALFRDLQILLGGHQTDVCFAAQIDSLACTVGFAAADLANADDLVDSLAADIKKAVRENWGYLRKVRATAGIGTQVPQ